MRSRLILFLSLAVLTLLSGCVGSTLPVGTKVADLTPAIWNAKWRGDDGYSIVKTHILDAKLGRVEMISKSAWLKPSEKTEVLVRTLGPFTIANTKRGDGYEFARVAIDNNHLVFFPPSEPVFEDLIRSHKIAGKIDKTNQWGYSCAINGFSETDFKRVIKKGVDPQSLFGPDPATVLIRYRWMPLW